MEKTWNLNDVLKGESVEQILNKIKRDVKKFKLSRSVLDSQIGISKFKEVLLLKERINVLFTRLQAYYYLQFYENITDSQALAKITYLSQLFITYSNEMIFFSLWFIKLKEKEAKKFINSKELADYKYYLLFIRKFKSHTKSEKIESILSLKSITGKNAFASLYEIISGQFKFDFNGKKGLSQEEVSVNCESDNPKLRKEAYETILKKYDEQGVVLTELYKNIVTDWCTEGLKIRGYKSPISIRNLENDISDKTIQVLLKVIKKNKKLFIEYFKIKYNLNKKNGQKYPFSRVHLYAPYKGKKIKYDYKTSKQIVLDAYKEFDERFYIAAKEIFDKKHVHSHPQKNKKNGAFCMGIDNKSTPYILLNHVDGLRDLFTMMHEFGHGIHDMFSRKQVNLLYQPAFPMAETASIFGEMLLTAKILRESSDVEEKKNTLIYLLDREYASIGRQAYFVFFEEFAHEKIINGATKEELDKKYYSLLKEQFGEMKIPELFKHEWNYIPHIYSSPFYCYSYAWGHLLVLALYAMYEKEGKSFIDKYIELLSTGGAKSPMDMLKLIGINPNLESFWQQGFDVIKERIEELKKLFSQN